MKLYLLTIMISKEAIYIVSFTLTRSGQLSKEPYFQWNEWHDWRLATEEEKQLLFDKMKEQGLKWNTEEKRVEKIRWRAKKGNDYYSIDRFCYFVQDRDDFHLMDDRMYNSFNYFRTEEQAREVARRVKEVLRKYHEEIGE